MELEIVKTVRFEGATVYVSEAVADKMDKNAFFADIKQVFAAHGLVLDSMKQRDSNNLAGRKAAGKA